MKVNFKNTISILIRLIFNLFEFTVIIIILFLFLVRSSFIQNNITQKFTQFLNSELSSKIAIKEVSLKSFKYFELNELLIPDQNGDTILFVPKVFIDVEKISLKNRKFRFNKLVLEDGQINIHKNKESRNMNFNIYSVHLRKTREKVKNMKLK